MRSLATRLAQLGRDRGLAGVGTTDLLPFEETRAEMHRRLKDGTAGRARFTYKNPNWATEPQRSMPWARSLVVGAWSYLPSAGDPGATLPDTGRIARFATADHYARLRSGLAAIGSLLEEFGYRSEVLVDDDRLVDRAAAVRSGIAWWGKNTMALAPGYGPWLLLGSVATDAELPPDAPMKRDCGTCSACIPACPTGALDVPGKLDATKCISYWAQTRGTVPEHVRSNWGDRLYGCDDCLEACPPGARMLSPSIPTRGRVDLLGVLAADDDDLLSQYDHFYLPGRRTNSLRRNALIALASTGSGAAVRSIAPYLHVEDPVLREQAAWTLGRLGAGEALEQIELALESERDPDVIDTLHQARERLAVT